MVTASDMSMEHYERPEVRETILDLCKFAGGLRGLNGGDGWYVHQDGRMRLRGPGDFAGTISKERSLYMTADVFDPAVFDIWERKTVGHDGMPKPEIPIGTRGDLVSYSLFADIDAVKDPDDEGDGDGKKRSKLYHKGRIEALEAAAGFMVRYLKDRGVAAGVGVLFSGQGIYVWLSPELSDMTEVRALANFDRDELDEAFKIWFLAFNDLLADIEKAFFEAFPEHVGRVKFDKLNHIKRKVKCLLSIHKTLPFAVVPLDRDDIKINLEAARIGDHGLPAETLKSARVWLSTWKAAEGERSALVKLLEPYRLRAAEDVTAKAKTSGEIRRSSEPIPVESWCPFYRALLEFPGGAGAHRVCGALATWLYQAGWSEEEAFQLWGPVADRCDVETRIFYTSYGVINSPNCETIKKRGAGYPVLRFGELGLCRPDETCKGCHWPGDYGMTPTLGARDFIETVKEGLKADPRKLKDRAVLAALLTLREKDPLEFDLLTDELKGAGVVKLPTLKKMIDGEERRQADEKAREEEAGERLEIAPDVEREADQILSAGLAFEYLYETWQARHLGDAKVGKALLGGFGAQRCVSTSGIHIQINGPREAGKSHSVEVAVDLLPPRLVMMGSMSNMTLYYDAENMPAGAAVSIDDITYTETFGAVQKRCTTGFQTGATHRSVVDSKDGKVVKKFTTKPRMAFYTTCVDRQQDEQLRSRLWSIDADSSPEHKQAVIDFRKKKDAGLLFDPAEEERKTAVCRAIFEDLDSHLFDVVIPYAERLVTSPGLDVRSYNVISDLTKSLAVYRYRVREKDDRGRVLATEKDFFDAKAIFDATEGHSDIKFTDAELRVLEALADLGFKASMSDLCRKTGLSKSRVDEILNGRGKGEQKRHGLMSKAPITREQESDSWTYDRDPDTGDFRRKTVTQFIYYLDPSFRLQGYKSLIKLETDNGGEVSGGFRKVPVVVSVDDNDNGKEVSGVSVEKTEEEDDNVLPLRGAVGRDGEDISSNTCPGKTTETTESPSPLAVRTTETSPETTENPRKPQEQKGDEDRAPTPEESEALDVARSLQAAGKRVTFGNVEVHLNKAEGYVETSRIWGILRALGALGWTTGKDGALSEGVVE